jgi:hypothetical protein
MNMRSGSLNTTILHIGAPKCGSTALQSAFFLNRDALKRVGIEYIGSQAHWTSAAKSIVGVPDRVSGAVPPITEWKSLLNWTARARHEGRSPLISSEWFASADETRIEHIVRDLGRDSLRVVLAIRPLTSTLPSAWQQGLKLGGTLGLTAWLEMVLTQPDSPRAQRVWLKHGYDRIATRWADVVGKDRIAVQIVDEQRPESIFQDFSRIANLPENVLSTAPKRTNPSLSAFEADVLAELNQMFFTRGGTLKEYRSGVLRTFDGYVNSVRQGSIEKSSISMQHLPAVLARNAEIARNIGSLGCAVVGDLKRFTEPAVRAGIESTDRTQSNQRDVDVRSAAGMMYSLIITAGITEPVVKLPGFGRLSARYRYQATSLARRLVRAVTRSVVSRLGFGRRSTKRDA